VCNPELWIAWPVGFYALLPMLIFRRFDWYYNIAMSWVPMADYLLLLPFYLIFYSTLPSIRITSAWCLLLPSCSDKWIFKMADYHTSLVRLSFTNLDAPSRFRFLYVCVSLWFSVQNRSAFQLLGSAPYFLPQCTSILRRNIPWSSCRCRLCLPVLYGHCVQPGYMLLREMMRL
jgi:hypothetical protein